MPQKLEKWGYCTRKIA